MDVISNTISPVDLIDDGPDDLQERLFRVGRDKLTETWPNPHCPNQKITAFLYALSVGHIEAVQILLMILPQDIITTQWHQWHQSEGGFFRTMLKKIECMVDDARQSLKENNEWYYSDFSWLSLPRFWLKQIWTLVGSKATLMHTINHELSIAHVKHWSVDGVDYEFPEQQWPVFFASDCEAGGQSLDAEFRSSIDLQSSNKAALYGFSLPAVFIMRSYRFAEQHLEKQWTMWRDLNVSERRLLSAMIRSLLSGQSGLPYQMSLGDVWSSWWFNAYGEVVDLDFSCCWNSCNQRDAYISMLEINMKKVHEIAPTGVSDDPAIEKFTKLMRSCSTYHMQKCTDVVSPFRQAVEWYAKFRVNEDDGTYIMPYPADEEKASETITMMRR